MAELPLRTAELAGRTAELPARTSTRNNTESLGSIPLFFNVRIPFILPFYPSPFLPISPYSQSPHPQLPVPQPLPIPPNRFPFFHKSADAFRRIAGLHQLVKIDILDWLQRFID